jgi:putative DNA primase/helicase
MKTNDEKPEERDAASHAEQPDTANPPAASPDPWRDFDASAPGLLAPPECGHEGSGTPEDPPATDPDEDDLAFIAFAPEPKPGVPPIWEFPANDDGRAAFIIAHIGEIVRYVPELGLWRIWHGHRWHDDTTRRLGHYCQVLSRHQQQAAEELGTQIMKELEASRGDPNASALRREAKARIKRATQAATSLGDEKTIASTTAAASRFPQIIVPLNRWDADPWRVGTLNGTLDLKNQTHSPGCPEDYITKRINVTWQADAKAPVWDRFIDRILPPALAKYLQCIAGYSLTGKTDDQSFYFLYGKGCNGKSVLVSTLSRIIGDYARHAPRNLVEQPAHGGGCKNEIAGLPGVRMLYGEETQDRPLREDFIKALTSGIDTLTGEKKFRDEFSFTPVAKLWLMGNEKPTVHGTSEGIWRRIKIIPFEARIADDERIPQSELQATFDKERSGILNWMLAGLSDLLQYERIPVPAAVTQASADYRAEQDTLAEFIAECTAAAAADARVPKQALYAAYRGWCAANGMRDPLSNNKLTRKLSEYDGWQVSHDRRFWMGKQLRTVPGATP